MLLMKAASPTSRWFAMPPEKWCTSFVARCPWRPPPPSWPPSRRAILFIMNTWPWAGPLYAGNSRIRQGWRENQRAQVGVFGSGRRAGLGISSVALVRTIRDKNENTSDQDPFLISGKLVTPAIGPSFEQERYRPVVLLSGDLSRQSGVCQGATFDAVQQRWRAAGRRIAAVAGSGFRRPHPIHRHRAGR
jgi:hypothetical protein